MATVDRLQVRITGLDEVQRNLKALGRKLSTKIIRQSLRAAARPVHAEAVANIDKDNSPRSDDTGRLRRSIKIRAGKRRRGQISIKVGVGKGWFQGETFYGAFREWGHKIGKRASNEDLGIRKRKRRTADERAAASAADDARKEVRPYPFIEPAYKSKGAEAAAIAEREILAGIEREAGRA